MLSDEEYQTIINYANKFQLETLVAIKTNSFVRYDKVQKEFTDYLYSLTKDKN